MKLIIIVLLAILFIPVHFAFSETMNEGKIYWKKDIISPNSFAKIIVEDNDMNKKEYPNFADKFSIVVWSDSSPDPIDVEVVETGVYSGVFTGTIYVSDTKSEGKKLFAKPGEFIYALYVDSTTNSGDTIDLTSAAVVKISGQDMSEFLDKLDSSMRSNQEGKIPTWIKNNALWWAEGQIDDSSFTQGIEFLIKENILSISHVSNNEKSEKIPAWIKNNALWWAQGKTSDGEFIGAIGHLIASGIISVPSQSGVTIPSEVKNQNPLDKELEKCQQISRSYERLNCEKEVKFKSNVAWYKQNAVAYQVGSMTFYYPGMGHPGNSFEINSSGQALLYLRILVENNSPSDNISMFCSGPSVCNYDVWNGDKSFKYSSQDFTSGQIVLKPGDQKEFNMFFGPNIGYGGTTFEYDSSKEYFFRITESWGSQNIPLNLSSD
jgi:hypothetical protein